jgi:LCP family protein required for cell wall assembly
VGVLTITGLLVVAMVLRLALEWRQALADIDSMIVTPVTIPETNEAAGALTNSSNQNTEAAITDATKEDTTLNQSGNPGQTSTFEQQTVNTSTQDARLSQTKPLTILLLGTDARPDDSGPTRTDAIVLVHLDPQSGKVSMLSLPRDLWVKYPGGLGEGRINGAYAIGEMTYGPGGGPALAKATVGRLVDLKVDHFVLINFQGFKTLIDRLGGISINVPTAINDSRYPTDDYRTIEVNFRKGWQTMNGERALMYARTRHADSDFGRNQRQQQVLMAIFERIRERGLLQQLTSLDDYTGALRGYVQTDINRGKMIDLASMARVIDTSDIRRFAIDSKAIVNLKKPTGATFAVEPKALERIVAQFTGETVSQAGGE